MFVNSGASDCYIFKIVVDWLGLQLEHSSELDVVNLKGGKTMPTLRFV